MFGLSIRRNALSTLPLSPWIIGGGLQILPSRKKLVTNGLNADICVGCKGEIGALRRGIFLIKHDGQVRLMTDSLTREERSKRMALIRGQDTKPEKLVRSIVHRLGYRFRLHPRDLPGTPDLAFPRLRCVIFVHGCFWHRHERCKLARLPKSKTEFWLPKLEANRRRDVAKRMQLRKLGWRSIVVWECQLREVGRVRNRLAKYLGECDQ